MAVQQNRKTPSKRGMRRSHDSLKAPTLSTDPVTGANHVIWQSGLSVIKIDLGNPDEAEVSPALELTSDRYNYWSSEVQATPQALLISTSAYDSTLRQSISTVHVVDIADPNTTPTVSHRVPVTGQVLNKFNMNLKGDILTVVSQVWRGTTIRQRHAIVETFDLGNPAAGESGPLGSVEVYFLPVFSARCANSGAKTSVS